jgi:hypothetical protein
MHLLREPDISTAQIRKNLPHDGPAVTASPVSRTTPSPISVVVIGGNVSIQSRR